MKDDKYERALEKGRYITENLETSYSYADISAWEPFELYDWLDFWLFQWNGASWEYIGE